MNFFVGLAAFTYTLTQVGPLGWFILFIGLCFVAALTLLAWPLLVAGLVLWAAHAAARRVARRAERKRNRRAL